VEDTGKTIFEMILATVGKFIRFTRDESSEYEANLILLAKCEGDLLSSLGVRRPSSVAIFSHFKICLFSFSFSF
jgi:hypothetical protein